MIIIIQVYCSFRVYHWKLNEKRLYLMLIHRYILLPPMSFLATTTIYQHIFSNCFVGGRKTLRPKHNRSKFMTKRCILTRRKHFLLKVSLVWKTWLWNTTDLDHLENIFWSHTFFVGWIKVLSITSFAVTSVVSNCSAFSYFLGSFSINSFNLPTDSIRNWLQIKFTFSRKTFKWVQFERALIVSYIILIRNFRLLYCWKFQQLLFPSRSSLGSDSMFSTFTLISLNNGNMLSLW